MREHCHWTGHVSLHGGQKAMLAQIATEGKLQGLVQELERLRGFVEAGAVGGEAGGEGRKIELAPLHARLTLPESDSWYVLQDWSQALDTEHAFSKTAETLSRILKLSLPVDSLARINRQVAQSAGGLRERW